MKRKNITTPLFRVKWDKRSKGVDVKVIKGNSEVPGEDIVEVSALDLTLAHQIKDVPILWLGESGTGKTHVIENFLATIAKPENTYKMSLQDGLKGNNVMEKFIEYYSEDNMIKARLKPGSIEQYIAALIDELTRGNTNDIIDLVDGKVQFGPSSRYKRRVSVTATELSVTATE